MKDAVRVLNDDLIHQVAVLQSRPECSGIYISALCLI